MPDLTLRGLDPHLLRTLEQRAEATGQSLDEVVRELIRIGLLYDSEGRAAVARKIRAMTLRPVGDDSTDLIRRLRDGS
jgi:plasmid stability protein